MNLIVAIVRELVKFGITVFYWVIPIYLRNVTEDNSFLWFFIISFLLTCVTFAHYENLADAENGVSQDSGTKGITVDDLYPRK